MFNAGSPATSSLVVVCSGCGAFARPETIPRKPYHGVLMCATVAVVQRQTTQGDRMSDLRDATTVNLAGGGVLNRGDRIVVDGHPGDYVFRQYTTNPKNDATWVTAVHATTGKHRAFHPSTVAVVVDGEQVRLEGWVTEVDALEGSPGWLREMREQRAAAAAVAAEQRRVWEETVGKVKFADLVDAGVVPPATVLVSDHGEATVTADGNLVVHDQVFTSVTAAAREAAGKAAGSGWTFWRLDGKTLTEVRSDYCTGGA